MDPNATASNSPADDVSFRTGQRLHQQGQLEQADALYRQVLASAPNHAEAMHLRGVIALQRGDAAAAAEGIGRALALAPDNPKAHSNLGIALTRLDRLPDAIAAFDRALQLRPDYVEALNNRGNALRRAGRLEQALVDFEAALRLKPDHAEAWLNLAHAQRELQRLDASLASLDRAVQLRPDNVNALISRGITLQRLKRPAEALACYEQALARQPRMHALHNNRGAALRDLKRYDEAAAAFEALAAAQPGFECAESNRLHSQLYACDWRDYDALVARVRAAVARGEYADVPFSFLAITDAPDEQQACARRYTARHLAAQPLPLAPRADSSGRRLRVAYLSADFHEHATAYLMAGLFEAHDRTQFETFAVSFGPDSQEPMRRRLLDAFDHFLDVRGLSDRDVAELLRSRGIDIAVDLKGYTADNRAGILAQRAAPVQVNYLGYPGTMGAPFIDYLIADATVVPPGHEAFYDERIVRLPNSYQVNDDRRPVPTAAPTRAALGLPPTGFVFCCFNNNYKIAPDTFAIWMRLLTLVDGSVLWLFEDTAIAAANLRRQAVAHGVAADRLVFASRVPPAEHLARHLHADLFLDTWPYNAHTTASDALWAGVPLLTRAGGAFPARVAASLLRAVGLPELIVETPAAYESLALTLARDPGRLATLRSRLQSQRHAQPLFDTKGFCRHLEQAFTEMHRRDQRGEAPHAFDVPAA